MPVPNRLALLAALIAVLSGLTAARFGARAVGGADSYGYVSQADGWLARDVPVHQRFLEAQDDRPVTQWAFVPLGWKPSKTTSDLVPFYAPGYPMLLAVVKGAFGHAAMFYLVPLLTGLLVWSTFVLGCRLGRPGVGVVAALFVASSATVLYMSMLPMSDVPSAALWTLALACVLGTSRGSAFGGGIAAALAILVRPNLLPLAGFMGLWLIVNDIRARASSSSASPGVLQRLWRGRAWLFAFAAAGGAVWIAILNNRWYGNPAESGYGNLGGFFNAQHVATNAWRYSLWLFEAETPLAVAGLLAVIAAPAWLSRRRDVVGAPLLLWSVVAWIWGTYFFYLVFDAWWFLRFMLPAFPIIALAAASLLARLWQKGGGWRVPAALIAIASVAWSTSYAQRHSAFSIGLTESRYPQVARGVASLTDSQSAILTLQHSGSMRYYGGRMTVRWDVIFPSEFGTLVSWLRADGHHPYLLADAGEMADLRARFAKDPAFTPVTWPPLVSFFNSETMLFDLDATGPSAPTTLGAYTHRAVEPVAPPHWTR